MSIPYKSTRGTNLVDFEHVVLGGLAPDKGLYVPASIPQVSSQSLQQMRKMDFAVLAYEIMSLFIKSDQIPCTDLNLIVEKSFRNFQTKEITPCIKLSHFWILELFHGPTLAFKDIALQFLGNLFEYFLKRGRRQSHITILGATSGDTGSAAIHGLKGKENVTCFILFPEGKITEIQERQMTTVTDDNIFCIGIEGDFDDAQSLVKDAFADSNFRNEVKLGAVNSINWARILAQITYYFYSWLRATDDLEEGSFPSLNYCVPTGNFGDILAGYYAKRMGLPINQLVVCTNQNDVLHRFFESGVYKRSLAQPTIAPSMDISVSSNFERYLYYLCGESESILGEWMELFEKNGELTVQSSLVEKAREDFLSNVASTPQIIEEMRYVYEKDRYLICPHTATAAFAATHLNFPAVSTVILGTAHYAKFGDAVGLAVASQLTPALPRTMDILFSLPTRKIVVRKSINDVRNYIYQSLKKY